MGRYVFAAAAAAFPMSPVAWESEHHEQERHYSSRGDQRASSVQMLDCKYQTRKRMERGGKGLNVGGLHVYVLVGIGI